MERSPFRRRIPTFPTRTVHVVVVDPGVGTERRPILASCDKYHFVAPDNGVLSLVYAREERMHVRHITSEHYYLQPVSNTFHARDIFAPVAAWLAKEVDSQKFGEEIEDYVRFNAPKPKAVDGNRLRGVVLKVDRFGNLITNITPQDAPMLFGARAQGVQDCRRQPRDHRNPQCLCRGRSGRSDRHSRKHGLSGDRRQSRRRRAVDRSRQRKRSEHHSRRGCRCRQGRIRQ